MAIPKAKFIGCSSADPDRYGLPRKVGIKLNDKLPRKLKEEDSLDQVGLPGPVGAGRRSPKSDRAAPRAN